jgi:DNA-binding transcriptional MerR regulator
MNAPNQSEILTTAECTARTGLTGRALRLYEEHGLIAPQRTAGGWRQYGPNDLVRLNAITLLKSAGLTLAQIAGVSRSDAVFNLREILSIHLENWRDRRADAERGQRIAEAALERLNDGGSLTVDELCNLIRSQEMSQSQEPPISHLSDSDGLSIPESVLDQYAGIYQIGDWNVLTVRRENARLLIDFPTRPGIELRPTSESDFETVDIVEQAITFDRNPDGTYASLRIRLKGGDISAMRIDGVTAEQVKARFEARLKDQKPLPGSEAAVRGLVEGLIKGQPDYNAMHPSLAFVARQQLPGLHATAAYLGAVKSIGYLGVGGQGWDVFDVNHERGTARVRIALRSDGLITGALFTVKDDSLTRGP